VALSTWRNTESARRGECQRSCGYGRGLAARHDARAMQFTRISDEQETQIGDKLALQYVSALPEKSAEARATEQYVNEVGDALLLMQSANSTIDFI